MSESSVLWAFVGFPVPVAVDMDVYWKTRIEDTTDWKFLQSELHGMAALQEAVCLDSLNRSEHAVAI